MNPLKTIKTWWDDICQVPTFEMIILAVMAVCTATAMIRDNWIYRTILYFILYFAMMSITAKDIKERKIKNVQQNSHRR